jgi:hypothetical protein
MPLTKEEKGFLEFLEQTLIPDLYESGTEATAEDFEKCIGIINRLEADDHQQERDR